MPRLINQPVWAGMVVRMDDGTTYAVELTRDVQGKIEIEHEEAPVPFGFEQRYVRSGRTFARIELSGVAGQVVHQRAGDPAPDMPSPPEELNRPMREIEA